MRTGATVIHRRCADVLPPEPDGVLMLAGVEQES
ncbi:hypothetical protein FHR38_005662 [Micromonospora polyrhachis]|uniref:Uncharacterized protein n=1 Tax=Micromonospora polyrhachis TaxID=1282883 RepID=A0A7W7SVZ0_9ACTN|nr:hypothetical protein [Micromonospora polyrhachis]